MPDPFAGRYEDLAVGLAFGAAALLVGVLAWAWRRARRGGVVATLAGLAPAAAGDGDDAQHDWWPLDTDSDRADLIKAIHRALVETHPGARISPRPPATAASEHLSAVALVAELDAFGS